MRRLALIAALILFTASQARAAEPVPGSSCAGLNANSFTWSGASQNGGVVNGLFCNGSTNLYTGIINFQSTGYVGIDTTSPAAPLHVNGEAIVSDNGLACSTTTSGAIRYNSSVPEMEWCNGSAWSPFDYCQTVQGYGEASGYAGGAGPVGGMWGDGTYLYMGGWYGSGSAADLEALTFNNGTHTWTDVAHTAPANGLNNIWGDGTYIYLSEGTSGIQAYTFNGTSFTLKGTYNTTMHADWLFGQGGAVFVADDTNGLRAFTFDGTTFTLKDTNKPTGAKMTYVWGDGTYIYVVDAGKNKIRAYTFNGTSLTLSATSASPGWGTWAGVWGDGTYIYFVGNNGYNGVYAYTFNGTTFTSKGSIGTIGGPSGLIWGKNGDIYVVADSRFEVFSFNGSSFTYKGAVLSYGGPVGVWVDNNNIYWTGGWGWDTWAYPLCH